MMCIVKPLLNILTHNAECKARINISPLNVVLALT